MANIELPKKFDEILQSDQGLEGIVKKTLYDFGEILKENRLYFFEEYTDHGIEHIKNVIYGSDKLISTYTYNNILKAKDISSYVLAIVLHDIGMHLTYDGIKSLLEGCHDDILMTEFNDGKWIDLWKDYFSEAKRFSGKQLFAIFGDPDIVIEDPFAKKRLKIDEVDKKLIGEFIRRNHPRIAHEIAIKGFPSKDSQTIPFAENLNSKDRYLIGFIARSHGMDIRKCLNHIENVYGNGKRTPNGIHAPFLMILIRLSDYLQIEANRTSKIVLKTKRMDSPVSILEHNSHLAIDNIDDTFQDDPERIYVSASPKNSEMFLKIRHLLNDIQNEFDTSWAIIGELYGNLKSKASINYRRIMSNLDGNQYIKNQNYIGDYFSFEANNELVKLLIAPLYGENPKYGVRELLQNSIDACNERNELEKEGTNYHPKIEVGIIERYSSFFFRIVDNGKGMNLNEIKNYFLSAGASFRQSAEWKELFIDDSGDSIVQRNGRFGIGVLAGFLIGKQIKVSTKSLSSGLGYSFTANLNSGQINVLKDEDLKIGTEIEIKIEPNILKVFNSTLKTYNDSLLWTEWFTLNTPEIRYNLLEVEINPYKNKDPHYTDVIPNDWNKVITKNYNSILWTYSKLYSNRELTCNGIVIPIKDSSYSDYNIMGKGLLSSLPRIALFDNNGVTPVSLSRNTLTGKIPDHDILLESIYKDVIAYLLTYNDVTKIDGKNIRVGNQIMFHPALHYSARLERKGRVNQLSHLYGESSYFPANQADSFKELLVSKDGFIVNYNYFLNRIKKTDLIYMQVDNYPKSMEFDIKSNFLKLSDNKTDSIEHFRGALIKNKKFMREGEIDRETFYTESDANFFMKKEKFSYLFDKSKKRLPLWFIEEVKREKPVGDWDWMSFHTGKSSQIYISKSILDDNCSPNFVRISALECVNEGDKLMNKLLKRYIGEDVIIPFTLEERKQKFPEAFNELKSFMKKYL